MVVRDRIVRWALGAGALLALLAWPSAGPWVSLVLVLLALGVAAVAYRIEAPRIDVEHPTEWSDASADQRLPEGAAPIGQLDQ